MNRFELRKLDDTTIFVASREALGLLAAARGKRYRRRAQYRPTGAPRECWTNAWELARSSGMDYAEGIAVFPNPVWRDHDWFTHAWCVDRKGRVVDPTPEYREAVEYRGFELPKGVLAQITAQWEGWRSSFLEAVISAAYIEDHEPTRRFIEKLLPEITGGHADA